MFHHNQSKAEEAGFSQQQGQAGYNAPPAGYPASSQMPPNAQQGYYQTPAPPQGYDPSMSHQPQAQYQQAPQAAPGLSAEIVLKSPQWPPILGRVPYDISLPALEGRFVARNCETIILRQKVSFSGDSFTVENSNGMPLMKVKGTVMSMSQRTTFIGLDDRDFLTLRHQPFNLGLAKYWLETPDKQEVCHINGKFSWGGTKFQATYMSTDGRTQRETVLRSNGDVFGNRVGIEDANTNVCVAVLDRKWKNARQLIGGLDTYAVIVAPGVDMTVIIAMCIALEERRKNQ